VKLKKADIILIAVVVVVALAGAGYFFLTRQEGARVVVTAGSGAEARILADIPLSEDTEMDLETEGGGVNHLVIRDGRAYVTEANCPDKICVRNYTGGICYDGETIICLPHKLVVTVKGGASANVDHVVN
jgi:hypothetical protein